MDKDAVVAAVKELVAENSTFVLATVGDDGGPRVRWMGAFLLDEPLVFWMAANAGSRKMDQIRANPRAQLMFQADGYVTVATLSGRCEVVSTDENRKRLWDGLEMMGSYFAGPDDPSLGVVKFTTERIELLDMRQSGDGPSVVEL